MNEKERKKIEQKQNKLLFTFSAANLDTTWGWGGERIEACVGVVVVVVRRGQKARLRTDQNSPEHF